MLSGLMGCALGLLPALVWAQSPLVVDRGGTVELNAADGYTDYQWQVSSDSKYFVNLPDGKVQHLQKKVFAPVYFRVMAKDKELKNVYLDTLDVKTTALTYAPDFSISGTGHGYVETRQGEVLGKGISVPEDRVDGVAGTTKKLTNWTNGNAMVVYYFNHPQDVVDTELYLKVQYGRNVVLRIKVFDPEQMAAPIAENTIALRGTGKEQKVSLVGYDFPRKAYFRYQIECLSGWKYIQEFTKFHHYSPSDVKTYKPAYLSSPSVHLGSWKSTSPVAPRGHAYDWCYQEVMMPKISDVQGTYVMSLGVLAGYMGIQMSGYDKNGESLHGVIFSMWDDGSTDKDPNLPLNLRANVLDHNEKVEASRFGNEGTGMKTYMHGHNWECDTFVQFITNCRPERYRYKVVVNGKEEYRVQDNTLVSAWFNAQDGKGWQYMATLRIPNRNKPMDSWYSFLENYNAPSGQALRKGFYKNGYGRAKSSKRWFHFNDVRFGHTDGGNNIGARTDYAQGASDEIPGAFFMQNGGYLSHKETAKQVPLNTDNTPVDTINLAVLEARVDQAIANEKNQIEKEELFKENILDKKGWELIDFSSEETSGEGENGRAALTIDGDVNTYWHTQWRGGAAQYPHHLTVDMKETYDINGMMITMSGGNGRYVKAFDLYLSDDAEHWTKVYSEDDAPNKVSFNFFLDKPAPGRYFKLVITDGRAESGCHVRINEIEVSGQPVATGVENLKVGAELLDVKTGGSGIDLSFLKSAEKASVTLCRADGAMVFNEVYQRLSAGENVLIPMGSHLHGVYVLSCDIDGKTYTQQVIWK